MVFATAILGIDLHPSIVIPAKAGTQYSVTWRRAVMFCGNNLTRHWAPASAGVTAGGWART
jgi:hypothetical protein